VCQVTKKAISLNGNKKQLNGETDVKLSIVLKLSVLGNRRLFPVISYVAGEKNCSSERDCILMSQNVDLTILLYTMTNVK
jgi:hypothetical protein